MKTTLSYPELKTLLDRYQEWTPSTAIYPHNVEEEYLISGLAAEVFEAADEDYNTDKYYSELGDIFWFLSQIGNMFGYRMADVVGYVGLDQSGNYITKFFSKYAKCYRKDYTYNILVNTLRPEYYGLLHQIIQEVEHCTPKSLASILEENYDKLSSRQERGVLEGDGGSR